MKNLNEFEREEFLKDFLKKLKEFFLMVGKIENKLNKISRNKKNSIIHEI